MPLILLSSNYTRSSFTLEDLVTRVKSDLAYANNNFITSGDVQRWANEAQTILARETHAFHVTVVSGTTSGTSEYPIPSDAVGRALSIEEVHYDSKPLPCVSINWLYANNRLWRSATPGTPLYYFHRGFSSVGLYPTPDTTDSDILSITYTAIPPEVTEDEDMFYIPHGCEDAIVIYCKLCACIKDAFGEGKARLDYYRNEWEMCKRRAREVTASVNENEVLKYGEQAAYHSGGFDPFWTSSETIASELP